jgi:hypothetical protein
MKAKLKSTGEIIEVSPYNKDGFAYINENGIDVYEAIELEVEEYTPDYWTKLEHQAAIAVMGGLCGNTSYDDESWEVVTEDSIIAAHTLVEKLKESK